MSQTFIEHLPCIDPGTQRQDMIPALKSLQSIIRQPLIT